MAKPRYEIYYYADSEQYAQRFNALHLMDALVHVGTVLTSDDKHLKYVKDFGPEGDSTSPEIILRGVAADWDSQQGN